MNIVDLKADLFIFVIFTGLNFQLLESCYEFFLRRKSTHIQAGYHVSTVHSLMAVVVHLILMVHTELDDGYIDELTGGMINISSLMPVWILLDRELAILLYNWVFSFSLAYSISDFGHLGHYRAKWSYYLGMLFHHTMMFTICVVSYYLTNVSDNPSFAWYMSLGALSELSTLLLNYIQLNHGRVSRWIKWLFIVIYFLVRPLSMTWITYQSFWQNGWLHPCTWISGMITGLNYYWFPLLLRKNC